MILKLLVFLSDFRFDNILWVVFLLNRGVPFLFIVFLESIFYSFYAITEHLIFVRQVPSKFFIVISPFLTLTAYWFIYFTNSYLLLSIAFVILGFSWYSYHINLAQRVSKIERDKNKKEESKKGYSSEAIIILSLILSNYAGGLLANLSWELFKIAALSIKIILIPLSIIGVKLLSNTELEIKDKETEGSFKKAIRSSRVLKLFLSKTIILAIFEFIYIFVALRLRTIFISPYHIGLLYSTEVLISIITLKYFYHFEALTGSHFGKLLTGISFFSLSALLFKDSFVPIALGFLFLSAAKDLNESLSSLNIFNSLKMEDVSVYASKEEFYIHQISSAIMLSLGVIYTIYGSLPLLYSVLSLSLLYFALLIF